MLLHSFSFSSTVRGESLRDYYHVLNVIILSYYAEQILHNQLVHDAMLQRELKSISNFHDYWTPGPDSPLLQIYL